MTLSFGPLRRRLILLLTIALVVGFYPAPDGNQSEAAGSGRSQPWLCDESSLAIIEPAAAFDQAENPVGAGRQIGLASPPPAILQASPARFPSDDNLRLYADRLARFPNKTGPPSL